MHMILLRASELEKDLAQLVLELEQSWSNRTEDDLIGVAADLGRLAETALSAQRLILAAAYYQKSKHNS